MINDIALTIPHRIKEIQEYIHTTPLYPLYAGSSNIWVKAENLQYTGSFKLRGASSKLIQMYKDGIEDVVTASTGNHGLAVALISSKLGMKAKIYVPENILSIKEKKLSNYNVELIKISGDSKNAEIAAREAASEKSIPFVSPYNDIDVIIGLGTIACELDQQIDLSTIEKIYVTVGGGGLISGIGSYIKRHYPDIQVVGCLPANSPVMSESIIAGKIIDMDSLPTLSDGSAGGIEGGTITFDLVKSVVDRFMTVSEEQIKKEIIHAFHKKNQVIEGAAAVAQACAFQENKGSSIVLWCGGNIDPELWLSLFA